MNDADKAADIGGLFAAIDAQDVEGFASFLTENAIFRFGSAPGVEGREAVAAAVGGFFGTIAGLRHKIAKTSREGDTLVVEGEVTYERHDGSTLTVPFADVFEYEGKLIARYKIYIDIGAL